MYSINTLSRVHVGRQGETGLRKVVIDCTPWTQAYTGLTIALVAIRPGEDQVYVPAGVSVTNGILTWIPDATDTAIAGTGMLGVQGTDAGENVIKSARASYVVENAVDTPNGYEPDAPEESWLAHAEAVLEDMLEQLAAESSGAITDWLDEHIVQETGYVIDDTLTVAEAAADAKAAGDAISGKISEPASEGTSGQALVTDGNGGRSWATVSIDVDDTLTQTGEAADAKAAGDRLGSLEDVLPEVVGKNLYDKTACGPENKKYYNLTTGAVSAADAYAVTGKIPVEASTQYIFSAGGVRVKHVAYFSGESGGTFISSETVNDAAFTTPASCTFVGINLFAADHTAEAYSAAIAAGQLEKGSVATPYEAYSRKRMISPDNITGGDALEAVGDVTAVRSLVNLFDKALAVNGKYIYNGSVASDAGWAYTGKIPVEPNTQYNLSRDPDAPMLLSTAYYEWKADGTYIGATTKGTNALIPIKTGANTAFIAVNMSLASHTAQNFQDTIDTLMLCKGTTRPAAYAAYDEEPVLLMEKRSDAFFANADAFKGLKWLATGTSLTWYDGQKYQAGVHTGEICRGYVGVVSGRKPVLVTNEGINGATLGNVNSSSLINRYTSLDWAGSDIATIEFGVNDYGNNVPVGTASDAAGTSSFAACLKTVIEYALAQNPQLRLVICTDPDVRGTNTNSNNNTLQDYTDVTLAIAKQYRLPVCDWYYSSGINALNKGGQSTDYMTADGTHPNDEGQLRMGAMLLRVFEGMVC